MNKKQVEIRKNNKILENAFTFLILNSIFSFVLLKNYTFLRLLILLGFDLAWLTYFLLVMTVVKIEINAGLLILTYENFLRNRRNKSFDILSIEYTYKIEAVNRYRKANVLRLLYNKKKIMKLYDSYEGWTETLLDDTVLMLDDNGVKRRFTGYALKDIYPAK